MFNCLVSKLKGGADISFEEKGQRYIFVLNNLYYVLQKNCHPGLLPPSLATTLDSLIDHYIRSYLDEYWFPLMLSYLEGDSLKKPCCSSLNFSIKEFFSICDSQMTWKVQKLCLRRYVEGSWIWLYSKICELLNGTAGHGADIRRTRWSRIVVIFLEF